MLPLPTQVHKFKRQMVPEMMVHKANKIYSGKVKDDDFYPAEVKAAVAEQLADETFVGEQAFRALEAHLGDVSAPHFDAFKASLHFPELIKATGPKHLAITRDDDDSYMLNVSLEGQLIVGRGDPREDGRTYLQIWREGDDSRVSREHCRLDAGPLMLIVTDLGSTTGTRYTPGDENSHPPRALQSPQAQAQARARFHPVP